ncbi:MAG TPA: Crp/Fnr family transcriptional regulator [Syntrophorhabdaceae bacterium]|jgi:CRP/FNR family transcriptional regulator/CRP/FNR family cyclic AMP-dependent transcriptional regulator
MKEYLERVQGASFFSVLTGGELSILLKIAKIRKFNKGHVIFEEGDTRAALHIILHGKVKISLYDEEGKEYVLDVIGSGGFFGELSMFDELTGFANIIATEETECVVIQRQDFVDLLMSNPAFTVNVLKTLVKKLRAANERIKGLAFLNVENRILRYLADIGEKSGVRIKDRVIIERGPTQVEIANSCGCSRETVSRMIKSLVNKNKISVIKRQYTLRPVYPT